MGQRGSIMAEQLTDEDLANLLREGESDRVEFKQSLGSGTLEEIRPAICAFANDLPRHGKPGVVFLGVRDDGHILGLTVTDELLRNLSDIKTDGNIVPLPSMTVEKRNLQGKDIAVISVQPSDSPPVRFRGRVHVRVGPRRGIATAQDERSLNEKRRYGDIPFDIQPVPSSRLSDLSLTQFENEYLVQAFAPDVLESNDRVLHEQLAATKMVASPAEPTPTVLGILVLGKNPQDFLPGAYVQFIKLDGTELSDDIIDSEDIGGSIPDLLRRLDEKLSAHNRIAVDFTSDRLEQRTSLYPIPAIQQITRNAVMHRTYELTNAPVRVSWFSDRIEILSPGGPFGAVTAATFGQHGITDYRNPSLAEAMRTLGFVQRFGVGIPTARRVLNEAGLPEPEFHTPENHVLVTIRAKSA